MKVFFEIHSDLPQEGPGSDASTLKALSYLKDLSPQPKVLDIGCGPGRQTLTLASKLDGTVYALDNHEPFLENLKANSGSHNIQTVKGDMSALPFKENEFDLIWSEGAIYIASLEVALPHWKNFIKPGGFLAFSEISWLTKNTPPEVFLFWDEVYPAMRTIDDNIKFIESFGYEVLNNFTLPESDWWDNYYNPIQEKISDLKEKHKDDTKAMAIINAEILEIDLYKKFSDIYGYVFYILKKPLK